MYTVVRHAILPLPPEGVWELLTEARHLRRWFADTAASLAPEAAFELSFGDGDAFLGRVVQWQPPTRLRLEWQFLGLGPRFTITYVIGPRAAGGSEVAVLDRGSLTVEELDSLREGWEDFLSRLARYAESGETQRYEWSQAIGLGALLAAGATVPELDDAQWWRAAFGGPRLELGGGNGERRLVVAEPRWGEAATEAAVEVRRLPAGTYLGVVHTGWEGLPADLRLAERRRYAGLWRRTLADLEQKYR